MQKEKESDVRHAAVRGGRIERLDIHQRKASVSMQDTLYCNTWKRIRPWSQEAQSFGQEFIGFTSFFDLFRLTDFAE